MKKLALVLWICTVFATYSLAQTESEALNLLKSDNWSDALLQIWAKRKQLTPEIISLLESQEEKIQMRAAQALRAISRPELLPPDPMRDGLGDLKGEALEALSKVWRTSSDVVKDECLLSLVHIVRVKVFGIHGELWADKEEVQPLIDLGKSATRPLLQLLSREDGDREFRFGGKAAIVRALAGINDPTCTSGLIELIGKSGGFLQAEAMQVLIQFDDPRTVGVLIDQLDSTIPDYGESPSIWALRKMGKRAVPGLLETVLKHQKATVRAFAASYFIKTKDARSISVLQKATSDLDPAVRATAARALANNPDPTNVPFLLPLLSQPTQRISEAAAMGLGATGDPKAFDPVAELLKDSEVSVRRAAVLALPGLDKERAVKALIPLIHVPFLQEAVIIALRPLLPKEAETHLIAIAGHAVDWLRTEAIRFLAELKSVAAVPVLLELVHGHNTEAREAAATALGQIKGPAADGLFDLLSRIRPHESEEALLALALTGDARGFETFERLLKANEYKPASIRALGRLGDRRAIPLVLPFLESTNGDEQRYSITAVGHLKAAEAIPTLIKALNNKKLAVSDRAAEALGRIGDQRALPVLLAMAQDRNAPFRGAYIEALEAFPGPPTVAVLIKILGEGFPVDEFAVRVLAGIGDLSVIPALESVAENDRSSVSSEARKAIEAIRKRLGKG